MKKYVSEKKTISNETHLEKYPLINAPLAKFNSFTDTADRLPAIFILAAMESNGSSVMEWGSDRGDISTKEKKEQSLRAGEKG